MVSEWEKTDWNCLYSIFAFSLFWEKVVFVLGSLRGETPCVSCLAFFINEKSFFEENPGFFSAVSSPSSLKTIYSGDSCCKPS